VISCSKILILTSNSFAPGLAFLSIGMFLSSCAVGSDLPSGTFQAAPEAQDYCPEIINLVDEFNAIALDGYLNDDTDTMDNMAFSAKKMSGLVKRAESEGVDLADAEVAWLKNLGLSADSFVILAQAGPDTFSDDELRGYLERIIGWYDVAGEECRVVVA
jgi:hypothetical protein